MNDHWTKDEDRLSEYVLGGITGDRLEEMRHHLNTCSPCRQRVKEEEAIAAGVRRHAITEQKKQLQALIGGSGIAIPWPRVLSIAAILVIVAGIGLYNRWFFGMKPDGNERSPMAEMQREDAGSAARDAEDISDETSKREKSDQPAATDITAESQRSTGLASIDEPEDPASVEFKDQEESRQPYASKMPAGKKKEWAAEKTVESEVMELDELNESGRQAAKNVPIESVMEPDMAAQVDPDSELLVSRVTALRRRSADQLPLPVDRSSSGGDTRPNTESVTGTPETAMSALRPDRIIVVHPLSAPDASESADSLTVMIRRSGDTLHVSVPVADPELPVRVVATGDSLWILTGQTVWSLLVPERMMTRDRKLPSEKP
ncbi:MAG: zf-HC2 domain-containing protein [Ignavibacteria bacterium]|nr:zf-HC2 domain-containing protein [Ignavibacteria bacterium]